VRSPATVRVVAAVVIGLAGAYGLVLRLWLLAHTPVNSDWAVTGLMAKSILSGHFWTFYWGQQYGGVEPYLVAPVVWLSGGSPWAMGVTAALLSAVAAVLVGLVVGATTGRRWLGWAATGAFAAGAVTTGILALHESHDLEAARASFPVSSQTLSRDAQLTTTYSIVADSLGAAAIVVGGVTLLSGWLSPSSSPPTRGSATTTRVVLGPASARLEMTF